MAVKNLKTDWIDRWLGLDTFHPKESLTPRQFFRSANVIVSPAGSILPLRSPANLNDALGWSAPILSIAFYERDAWAAVLFDLHSNGQTLTYSTTGSVNTLRRSGQADGQRFMSLNVANRLYRHNTAEFIQVLT